MSALGLDLRMLELRCAQISPFTNGTREARSASLRAHWHTQFQEEVGHIYGGKSPGAGLPG